MPRLKLYIKTTLVFMTTDTKLYVILIKIFILTHNLPEIICLYYRGIAKIGSSDRPLHHLLLHNDKIPLSLHCGPLQELTHYLLHIHYSEFFSRPISCFLSGANSVAFSVFLRLLAHGVRAILRVFSLLEMNRPFFALQDAILSSNLTPTFARIFRGDVI